MSGPCGSRQLAGNAGRWTSAGLRLPPVAPPHRLILPGPHSTAWRPKSKSHSAGPHAFYLEEQFIKGGNFASLLDFHHQLAVFEADDLDVYVHATTQERAIDRFQADIPYLTPLPEQRYVGTLAHSRKVSWDCLVSFRGSRYSVPAVYAGKRVWLMASRGTHLLVLDTQRQIVAE